MPHTTRASHNSSRRPNSSTSKNSLCFRQHILLNNTAPMGKTKQFDLFQNSQGRSPRRIVHGGSSRAGMRKVERPLDTRRPLHLVLKSKEARGRLSFLAPKNRIAIERIVKARSTQFGVKIHSKEVMGNHIHIVATFAKRRLFQNFLRTLTALISREVTGARRGQPFGRRFWDGLAFSRVVMGRIDFRGLTGYLKKNQIEREVGHLARRSVEEYQRAERQARRRGCDIRELL
jgi:REP element-mobilizing transposase RayT